MNDSLELAEAFLQEAVFRSRAVQAAGTALAQLGSDKQRQCGLGAQAAIELDLTPRALELAQQLWPDGLDAALNRGRVATLRRVMAAWIERQDALDRERNHFLKAFRKAHGFDRRAYSAEQLAEYESGLAAINARADAERRAAAVEVLA